MNSVFSLKKSIEELDSINQGVSRMDYEQHPPTRDVTLNNFPNGSIHFKFDTSGQKWWMPSKSYFRVRCQLAKADGTPLTSADNIAPNMGLCSSLFQSAEFRINDKVVSRISDFMPQIDALQNRLTKSKSWLDSVGTTTNFWESQFHIRKAEVTSDGQVTEKKTQDVTTRAQMGFAAVHTVEIAADTGVLTFADGAVAGAPAPPAVPDVRNIFRAGDEIAITVSADVVQRFKIFSVPSATTLDLGIKTIALAAGALEFSRIRDTDVSSARNVSEFELIWTPPLSIFKIDHALPSGKYEIVLNPHTAQSYQKYAIESLVADKVPNTGTTAVPSAGSQYIFNVADMYFYCNTLDGPRSDDTTYLLDLDETLCVTEQFGANQAGFSQRNFNVPPSTYGLTVAYQDSRSGSNTRFSPTTFKVNGSEEELKLNRFYINFSSKNFPQPDADPDFVAGKDYTTQRYIENALYSGGYFDTGGIETLSEWKNRGPYYHFLTPRDGTDSSTRVVVHNQFQVGTNTTNMRLLLFSHYKAVARVEVSNGRVVSVQVEEV